ncbi:MAG: bifunctional phosphoserine phosphatase/homoserine phosphotransferase ThrH [Coriobacteriales bacterium]|jgi:phosphoserine/homoserine phosphotransferase
MYVVCLDLETTLVPEFWIEIARATGIEELRRTTRDEPDYDLLMRQRIKTLREHGIGMDRIESIVAGVEPLPGAKDFLDALRAETQVILLSDTFRQFAHPMMEKLGWPTIFYNELSVDADGFIDGYHMRVDHMKLASVRALQSIGFDTMAVGDSFNDVEMIRASAHGWLIHGSQAVVAANPDIAHFDDYPSLLAAIERQLGA